ncbi:hypothetical protein JQX13_49555 [Archangium violaceum]|uniref:hypothetical protein n=1 Tax=Archangium violaceum TaxID=83451 RepID=UPI00193C02A5|nr:hypothetical protein [Archangium violaceum]QRK07929.1 hypothetical protein JQX13_49555 [Archangium violaceum]
MSRHGMAVLGLVAALGTAGTAAAQEEEPTGKVKVFLRGGVGNYTGTLGDIAKTGPSWGLTVNLQPMRFLGFELGYEGAHNPISEAGVFDLALTRHGGSALVKLSPPFLETVRPFVGAGVGGSYVFAKGTLLGGYQSGLVGEVPLAAGIEFNVEQFTAGARATYRLLLDEDLSEQLDNPSGGFFDVVATLGLRF